MAFPAPKTAVYRKTKQGDFVIFGPVDQIEVGPVTVHLKSGATKKTHILSVGATFDVESVPCRYGYQTVAVSEVTNAVAEIGGSKPTASRAATIFLDASDFAPDSAFTDADDVPSNYDTEVCTGEFTMSPSIEAFILPPFDPDNPYV